MMGRGGSGLEPGLGPRRTSTGASQGGPGWARASYMRQAADECIIPGSPPSWTPGAAREGTLLQHSPGLISSQPGWLTHTHPPPAPRPPGLQLLISESGGKLKDFGPYTRNPSTFSIYNGVCSVEQCVLNCFCGLQTQKIGPNSELS